MTTKVYNLRAQIFKPQARQVTTSRKANAYKRVNTEAN